MNFIEQILLTIQLGLDFDTHYLIEYARKHYSDDYIRFVAPHAHKRWPTSTAHRIFGIQVAKFAGKLIKRQPGRSRSTNCKGYVSSCAKWQRI